MCISAHGKAPSGDLDVALAKTISEHNVMYRKWKR